MDIIFHVPENVHSVRIEDIQNKEKRNYFFRSYLYFIRLKMEEYLELNNIGHAYIVLLITSFNIFF